MTTYPRVQETLLCHTAPSLRCPRRSLPRCGPRGGARGTAPGSPATSCGGARLDAPRQPWPRSCSARAPACTAPCEPSGRAPARGRPTTRGRWFRLGESWAPRALTWQATRGIPVAADTLRRWLPAVDWVWTRPPRVAKADDPRRVARMARLRVTCEPRKRAEALVCADALDRQLWPTVGDAWRPTGRPMTGRTPGPHAQRDLAGALALATGALRPGVAARHTTALCRDRLTRLAAGDPAARDSRLSGVVDHDPSPHAKAVAQGLAAHPRLTRRWWPTDGPRAHPSARACGAGHDRCTRQHTRTRLRDLGADVDAPRQMHGPGQYTLSELSDEPAVTAAVENMAAEPHAKIAA
jgi:hypothetical protein